MKAQNLIDEYNQKVEAEERARAQKQADFISAAQAVFVENCRTWLGDLWDEFHPGEVKSRMDKEYTTPQIRFFLPVTFMGVDGEIEAWHVLNSQKPWSDCKLDFGWLTTGKDRELAHISLQTNTEQRAEPIDPLMLGGILAKVAKAAPIRAENARKELEKKRADALVFYPDQIPEIAKKIQERAEKFPDLADQIREAGRIAMEEYAQLEFERQEENTRYSIIQAERERLERLGDLAWDLPFTVYGIKFGALLEDDEGDTKVYAESIYTLNEDPGPDGYYRAFSQGKLTRMIRPAHVLSVEKIKVTDRDSAPYEIQRFVELTSRTVPEAEVSVYLPAVELVVFDLDEMEVFLA